MSNLILVIKGALIGVANIIPGVSGGTMAVSMGIYNQLIVALTEITHNLKKSLRLLVPVVVGLALGIICFTYVIEYLLREFALPTCLAFVGLILGGLPLLWRMFRQDSRNRRVHAGHALCFALFFALVVVLPLMGEGSARESLGGGPAAYAVLFLVGVIASATMVIPGISGSMVMMILGYYNAIIGTLKSFFEALRTRELPLLTETGIPLVVFGIGVLAGIFLIAKGIRFLFERFPAATYSGIFGLVCASPVAVFINTGSLREIVAPGGALRAVAGAVLLVVCFCAVFFFDRAGEAHARRAG